MGLGYNVHLNIMGRTSRKRHQKKKHILVDIKESQEEILTRLKYWMLKNNCLSVSDLVPYDFPTTGRGLKTLRNIEINDSLIEVPHEMLITTSTVSESLINVLFTKDVCYSAHYVLSLFLIYEAHLGKKSKWYPYITSLPQTFTNPEFCSNKEKSSLPSFIIKCLNHSHNLQVDYRLVSQSMRDLSLNGNNKCPHCSMVFEKIITFDRYRWAYYVVNTRAVYVDMEIAQHIAISIKEPNNLGLAPFLDFFNHDVHTSVEVSTITDVANKKFYQIRTLKPFTKGSQVFINYGSHCNIKLYIDYGFMIPNNPLDEINFNMHDIQSCINISKPKLEFIISNDLQKNMAFIAQGLNYNALCTLFICTTKISKTYWSMKIYGGSVTSEELFDVHNISKMILNLKKKELLHYSTSMKNFVYPSESFSIAISLIEEYLMLLNQSFLNLNATQCFKR